MNEIAAEFGQPTWLSFSVIALRLAMAAILAALLGLEREWRQHSAGLRTHILVSLAAASFAILGIEIINSAQFTDRSLRVDPIRLIEAVTAGVAFLAAGTIIFARGEVKGLTTGAGLWLAGAIGLASGLGFWQVAGLATLLGLLVLGLLHLVEDRFFAEKADGEPIEPAKEKGQRPGKTVPRRGPKP